MPAETVEDEAFVSLVTNNSYANGALVLGYSLRRVNTTRKLVLLVAKEVLEPTRERLARVWDHLEIVDLLDSEDATNLALLTRPELGITFTKIHCWNLTQYRKCVFLDADTLVVQNCDELFERDELSAVPDIGWPDCFNSGVFVFEPSRATYEAILEHAIQNGSFDGGDQGLLNSFFSDWRTADISRHLSFVYNMNSNASYTYAPAFQQFGRDVKIVHFIGPMKPWHYSYNPATGNVSMPSGSRGYVPHERTFLQLWWDTYVTFVQPEMRQCSDDQADDSAFSNHYEPEHHFEPAPYTPPPQQFHHEPFIPPPEQFYHPPPPPPPQHYEPPQHHEPPPQHHEPPPQHHEPPPQHHEPPPHHEPPHHHHHHEPPPQHHESPPQHHEPPPPHHEPPRHHHEPPPQHHEPPPQYHEPPHHYHHHEPPPQHHEPPHHHHHEPPPQHHEPPPQHHEPPPQHHEPPHHHHEPPPQHHEPPPHHHRHEPPPQHHEPPPQHHEPPPQHHEPPHHHHYEPPPQHHEPPPQHHEPPPSPHMTQHGWPAETGQAYSDHQEEFKHVVIPEQDTSENPAFGDNEGSVSVEYSSEYPPQTHDVAMQRDSSTVQQTMPLYSLEAISFPQADALADEISDLQIIEEEEEVDPEVLDLRHRQAWESGEIDYGGRDKFDFIQERIWQFIGDALREPTDVPLFFF